MSDQNLFTAIDTEAFDDYCIAPEELSAFSHHEAVELIYRRCGAA